MVAETREHLQHIASEFERACDSMGLKINVGKSKVLTIKKDQMGSCEKVRVNGEEMQEVDKFNYLGVMISTDGCMGEEVAHRVLEGRKVLETMAKLWRENVISREVKRKLYERVVIPTMVYGSKTWLSAQERRKIQVLEILCLRNICGITRVDRVRNVVIRARCRSVDCSGRNSEERVKMVRACRKNERGKVG